MKHIHYMDQEPEIVDVGGAKDVVIRHLITEKDGAPNFNLRVLTIGAGGMTPDHTHPWEHEFFIINGKGIYVVDNEEAEAKPGDVIFIPPNIQHCFRATEKTEII